MSKQEKRRQKHRRILDAALAEFSSKGFSGASMQAIAEGAGVSKPTLYQYIGQKDALFRAVLERGRAEILAPFEGAETREMVDVLWRFSWTYADFVLRPDTLSVARLVIGEAERVPEIARQFQETGPLRAQAGIAEYLRTLISWSVRARWWHKRKQWVAMLQAIADAWRGRWGQQIITRGKERTR